MKKFLVIFSLLVATILSGYAKEQGKDFNIGIRAGLNIPNISLSTTYNNQTTEMPFTSITGFNFGVLAEFPLSENFAFQPGILYSIKGGKETIDGTEFKLTLNYLHIPLNLLYKFKMGNLKPFVLAGGYIAYAISGKITRIFATQESTQDVVFGTNKDMLALEGGICLGAGVELSKFRFFFNYDLGLINYFTDPSEISNMTGVQKNNVISFSFGYFFN